MIFCIIEDIAKLLSSYLKLKFNASLNCALATRFLFVIHGESIVIENRIMSALSVKGLRLPKTSLSSSSFSDSVQKSALCT